MGFRPFFISLLFLVAASSALSEPLKKPEAQVEAGLFSSTGSLDGIVPTEEATLHSLHLNLSAKGELPHNLFYSAGVKIQDDRASYPFAPQNFQHDHGIPYNVAIRNDDDLGKVGTEKERTWDTFHALLEHRSDWLKVETGVGFLSQGPAERNPLVLAGDRLPWRPSHYGSSIIAERSPLLHATFQIDWRRLSYRQSTAELKQKIGHNKYLHNHRVEFSTDRFSIAAGEQIIYGSTISKSEIRRDSVVRELEWIYALPFVPYFSAERFNGDRDNVSVSIDFSLFPFSSSQKAFELYGELLVDDFMSPEELFDSSWWGNKWGFTGGIRNAHQGVCPWGWGWEYTRIEPWVGTHSRGAANNTMHFGYPLGSDLGPNSQEHWFHIDIHPSLIGELRLFHSTVWKGTDRGSEISDIHTKADGTGKTFLDPATRLRWNEFGVEWRRVFAQRAELQGGLSYLSGDTEGWRGAVGVRMGLRPL